MAHLSSMCCLKLQQAYSTWQLSRTSRAVKGPTLKCSSCLCLHHSYSCPSARTSCMTKPRVSMIIKTTKRHVMGRHEQIGAITVMNLPQVLSFLGPELYMKITTRLRSPLFSLKYSSPILMSRQAFSRAEFVHLM